MKFVEGAVLAMAGVGFCLMLVALTMIARQGGWETALRVTADGRWPLPRWVLAAGAALGAISGVLMFFLGLSWWHR